MNMIEVAVYNQRRQGSRDPSGGRGPVRRRRCGYPLLKQAIVMYHANNASVQPRPRAAAWSQVPPGSCTSRRAPAMPVPVTSARRSGWAAAWRSPRSPRDFGKDMPQKQRQLARDSAILAKLQSGQRDGRRRTEVRAPKTKEFAAVLGNLKIDRSCLVTIRATGYECLQVRPESSEGGCYAGGRSERGRHLQPAEDAVYQRGVYVAVIEQRIQD